MGNIPPTNDTPQIEELVDKILKSKLNISVIPDSVERKLYLNILSLLIGLLDHGLESLKIDFLGWRITFMVNKIDDIQQPPSIPSESEKR